MSFEQFAKNFAGDVPPARGHCWGRLWKVTRCRWNERSVVGSDVGLAGLLRGSAERAVSLELHVLVPQHSALESPRGRATTLLLQHHLH